MNFLQEFSARLKKWLDEPRRVTVLDSGPLDDEFALAGFLLASPALEAVLGRIGQDARALRAAVENYTGTENRGSRASVSMLVQTALRMAPPDTMEMAENPENWKPVVFAALVLKGVPAVRSVLEAAGADLGALVYVVAHGAPEAAAVPAPADADAVAIFNDNFTPMEFVVGTLSDAFSMDREAAIKLMLQIHREGSTLVPCASPAEAARIAAQINAQASAKYYPLRCKTVAGVSGEIGL